MNTDQYHTIYFLGIGGIGMSALARWFCAKGNSVSGYDKTPTELTGELQAEGIAIHFEDSLESIPEEVIREKDRSLIVYTPAIPKDHAEFRYLKESGYTIMKRSEVLGWLTKGYRTVAVAGTHGKTTTSSMIAHILKEAGKKMVAFLGGVTANYATNLVMHGDATPETLMVAEADEFDRSFLHLFPQVAVVTSADPDHLDIYGNHDEVIRSFREFIGQINKGGSLIIHETIAEELTQGIENIDKNIYSMSRGQFFAGDITVNNGFFEFDLHGFAVVERIKLGVPGFHNIENAIAASVASSICGVDLTTIAGALRSFRGVKRRFEFILRSDEVVYIDDYAHHPTEIRAILTSVRSMYPGRKITVVFQPHLYSRTRDFADGFSESLSLADEVFLMDIYPARELPVPGVSSDMLMDKITSPEKIRCSKTDLMDHLTDTALQVIVTLGAGDIDTFVDPIKKMLQRRYETT